MQKSKLLYVPTWRDELFTSYDHHNIMTEHDNFLSENMPFTSHKNGTMVLFHKVHSQCLGNIVIVHVGSTIINSGPNFSIYGNMFTVALSYWLSPAH